MAEDAPEPLASLSKLASSFLRSSFFLQRFSRKAELLSYLILCVAKMPFIPQVSIPRSVSGLTGKERPADGPSPAEAKPRGPRDDKGGSVKERLTLNLKQLGKKSQPRSHLPTAKAASGAEAQAKRRDRALPSSQTDSVPASSSGESLSKAAPQKGASAAKSGSEAKARAGRQEEARFTLTLTPEAVLLLQRRNSERRRRSAARNSESAAPDSRRRKENVPKRNQPGARDASSLLKISLLNERHRYDDVEYEDEEGDYGADERVVLKCTEWLRGLESTPVTAGGGPSKSASGVKSF